MITIKSVRIWTLNAKFSFLKLTFYQEMPKYVLISNYPLNSCTSANAKIRGIGNKLGEQIPLLRNKHNIKPEIMLHPDPGLKLLWVLEAPNSEVMRDLIYDGGFHKYNDFEFYMGSSLEWIMETIQKQPPIS